VNNMDNEGENAYFKGSTDEAIRHIREDVREMRKQLDCVCKDHERRLTSMESTMRVFKWLYGAVLGLLVYLGLKP